MAEKTVDEVTERLNNLGHLSAGVGHHVINAFSAIVSNAELLRLKPNASNLFEPAALAETIVRTALEAATVARRLIDYTRPVTSIDIDRCESDLGVSLDRLIEEIVDEEQNKTSSDIEWVTELGHIPLIRGHTDQLRSMFGHLIRNSYEALPPGGGTLEISTSTDARGWVVVELRDSGQGMDSETMARAVEPFFSTKPGNLGVGLSIANGIWRRHRGTLSVRSHAGEGTTIRLCVEPYQG